MKEKSDYMFCSKCGAQIDDKSYYCQSCGQEINKPYTQQPFNVNNSSNINNNNTSQSYQSGYTQQTNGHFDPVMMNMIKGKIEDARTMGILAIVLGILCTSIAGIVLGLIGISKLNSIQTYNMYNPEIEMLKEKARKLNLIGIILPVVLRVILIVLYFIIIFAMAGTLAGMAY